MTTFDDPATLTPAEARALCRAGAAHPTAGWATGFTGQAALMASRPPFAITHAPGYLFVSDRRDAEYGWGER